MGLNSYSCVGSQTLVLAEGPRVPQACGPQTIYTYNGSHGLMLEKVRVSSDKRTTDSPYMQGHTALYSGSHTVWCWPKTRVLRQANHRLSVPAMGRTVLYSGSHGLVQWVARLGAGQIPRVLRELGTFRGEALSSASGRNRSV